jgi:hypothetical protein
MRFLPVEMTGPATVHFAKGSPIKDIPGRTSTFRENLVVSTSGGNIKNPEDSWPPPR